MMCDILRRLPAALRPLQLRRRNRQPFEVIDEYDMQDLAHSALRMIYSDVRPEEFTPSSGGGASRMDFLVKAQVAAVEVKVTRSGRGPRDIKPELLVDINDYKGHPAVKTLVAVIYDIAGTFDNPGGFEADMSRTDGELEVIVIVAGWPTTPQRP